MYPAIDPTATKEEILAELRRRIEELSPEAQRQIANDVADRLRVAKLDRLAEDWHTDDVRLARQRVMIPLATETATETHLRIASFDRRRR